MAQQIKHRPRRPERVSLFRVALNLESQFCEQVEDVAYALGLDRSAFIRAALREAIDRHKSGQSIAV